MIVIFTDLVNIANVLGIYYVAIFTDLVNIANDLGNILYYNIHWFGEYCK